MFSPTNLTPPNLSYQIDIDTTVKSQKNLSWKRKRRRPVLQSNNVEYRRAGFKFVLHVILLVMIFPITHDLQNIERRTESSCDGIHPTEYESGDLASEK
jgi:hypothetical protein